MVTYLKNLINKLYTVDIEKYNVSINTFSKNIYELNFQVRGIEYCIIKREDNSLYLYIVSGNKLIGSGFNIVPENKTTELEIEVALSRLYDRCKNYTYNRFVTLSDEIN